VIKRQLYSELYVLSETTSFIFQHHWQRINVSLPSDVQVYFLVMSRFAIKGLVEPLIFF